MSLYVYSDCWLVASDGCVVFAVAVAGVDILKGIVLCVCMSDVIGVIFIVGIGGRVYLVLMLAPSLVLVDFAESVVVYTMLVSIL